MKRAMYMKRVQMGAGDALLYRLSDPIEKTTNVVVSAATAPPLGERVTMFPANEHGKIASYEAIEEVVGTLDHEAVLVKLGYEIL